MKVESLDDAQRAMDSFILTLWEVEHNNGAATVLLDGIKRLLPNAGPIAMEIQWARERIALLEAELDAFKREREVQDADSIAVADVAEL